MTQGSQASSGPQAVRGHPPPYSEERRQQQRQDAKEHGLPFLKKEEQNAGH